jgi:predicted DCC family thiol-disulfide oxidoreductase YuxK
MAWCSNRRASRAGSVLIYDGECGFCATSAKWAARGFRQGETAQAWQLLNNEFLEEHGLSRDEVEQAAWWVDDTGRRERGHRAVGRALQARSGCSRILGWLVVAPPSSWLAAGIYRWVVRWRYRLPGGTPECKVDAKSPKV